MLNCRRIASVVFVVYSVGVSAAPPTIKQIETEWATLRAKCKDLRIDLAMNELQKAKMLPEDFPPEDLRWKSHRTLWFSGTKFRCEEFKDPAEPFRKRAIRIQTKEKTITFDGDGSIINRPEGGDHYGSLDRKTDEPIGNHAVLIPISYLWRSGLLEGAAEPTRKGDRLLVVKKRDYWVEEIELEATPPYAFAGIHMRARGLRVLDCPVTAIETRNGVRVPTAWKCDSYREAMTKQGPYFWGASVKLTGLETKAIDQKTFEFKFPPKTYVYDQLSGKQYFVRDDGSREDRK